jgi:hypothetical protein
MKKLLCLLLLTTTAWAQQPQDAVEGVQQMYQASWATGAPCLSCMTNDSDAPAPGVDLYSPAEAFRDILNEPLVYVGRDYIDPVLDENGQVIPGGNLSCIYRNSKVYVVHDGCRPNHTLPLTALSMSIYSRQGGKVHMYQEANVGNYNITQAGPNYAGSWRVESKDSAPIVGELNFLAMANFVKKESTTYDYTHACTVGGTITQPRCFGPRAQEVQAQWSDAATDVWTAPLQSPWPQVHEKILKAPRN